MEIKGIIKKIKETAATTGNLLADYIKNLLRKYKESGFFDKRPELAGAGDYTFVPPPKRRSYERFIVEAQSVITAGDAKRPSRLRDISAQGAGLVCDFPLTVNQLVRIDAAVPALLKEPFSREGRVCWSNKIEEGAWRAGLDFGWDNKISFDHIMGR